MINGKLVSLILYLCIKAILIYLMIPLKALIILLAIFSMHLLVFKIFLVLGKGLCFFLEETNSFKKDTFSRTLLFFFDTRIFKSFNGVSFFLKPHKTPTLFKRARNIISFFARKNIIKLLIIYLYLESYHIFHNL